MSRSHIRMKRELEMLSNEPPPGVSCYSVDHKTNVLQANIIGNNDTPFQGGVFILDIMIPDRYPFEPPLMKFVTPIYHPNIDSSGRICLDLLKMPPKGGWKPSLNISTLLKSIQLLMNNPNPDDPLMIDIANEFRSDKYKFVETAKNWTKKYAMDATITREKIQSRKRKADDVAETNGISAAKVKILSKSNKD